MFFLKPDPYLKPNYLISPFDTSFISFNNTLPNDNYCTEYLNQRFGNNNWILTKNGREAIQLVYEHVDLIDNTIILTTSNNHYISRCVTETISNFGKWTRVPNGLHDIVLIHHEFGFCCEPIVDLKSNYVIEDYCTSFFLKKNVELGVNSWWVYSFPKFFPIQVGGLLVGKDIRNNVLIKSKIGAEESKFILNTISYYLKKEEYIFERRIYNYNFLAEEMYQLGFEPRFEITHGIIPYVFLFKSRNNNKIDWDNLKLHFYNHGIQCSVFYGEESFFIPVHQELKEGDLRYFIFVMKTFLNNIK